MRVILSLFILFGLVVSCGQMGLAKTEEPVKSTEGFEIDSSSITNTKPGKDSKQDWKIKRKETKQYFKLKNAIRKNDYKRTKKQKEIEYLEKRLEMKKTKLKSFNSDSEKGEKEE